MTIQIADVEHVLRALADPTRLRIMGLLLAGEVCVCDIHETLAIPQPKASRHLAYLRRAGLVDARREGLWMHYRLADVADPVLRTLVSGAIHALTHLDVVRRDGQRLQKKTGCCVPDRPALGLPCCAGTGAGAKESRKGEAVR